MKNGHIVVIDDDPDDHDILRTALEAIGYKKEVLFFEDPFAAYDHLSKEAVKPFIILCDINMPRMDGFQLRDKLHSLPSVRVRCAPFIFFTTASSIKVIESAYTSSAQGYFVKPSTISETARRLKLIIDYWSDCLSPVFR